MIVVDSSVWIGQLRNRDTDSVRWLRAIENPDNILVGDLVLLEVLQGARDDRDAARIERSMRSFKLAAMLDDKLATRAAANYRYLRRKGVTIRKTADLIIGTFCLWGDHELLHDDRDFAPLARHLGLKLLLDS